MKLYYRKNENGSIQLWGTRTLGKQTLFSPRVTVENAALVVRETDLIVRGLRGLPLPAEAGGTSEVNGGLTDGN